MVFGINNTAEIPYDPSENFLKPSNIVILIIVVTLTILTVLGNGMVILSWIIHRPIRNPSNLLLVSLAISDFLTGIITIPLNSLHLLFNEWQLGPIGCQLSAASGSILLFVGSNHLVLIAIDRYQIIKYGVAYLNQRTIRSTIRSIVFVWYVGFLVCAPYLLDRNGSLEYVQTSPGRYSCTLRRTAVNVLYPNTFSLFVPSILMIYFYAKIYFGITKRLRNNLNGKSLIGDTCNDLVTINVSQDESNLSSSRTTGETSDAPNELANCLTEKKRKRLEAKIAKSKLDQKKLARNIRKSRRAARTLGILIACFSICFYPLMLLSTLHIVCGLNVVSLYSTFVFLGQINSAVNPVIYVIHNKDFRFAFKKMGMPLS